MDKEERSPEDGVGTRNPESEFRSPVRSPVKEVR